MTYDEANSKLMSLKKGDFIWAVSDESLFKTYDFSLCNERCICLGYDPGNPDADYDDSMYCFEMADVPKVSKPVKMVLVGKLINDEKQFDIGYVFISSLYDADIGQYNFGQHVLIPLHSFKAWHDRRFCLDDARLDHCISLKLDDVCFSEAECIAECRERNNMRGSIRKMKLISKTINSMKKQLKEFMESELVVDHEKLVADDLKVKTTSIEDAV